MTSLSTYVQKYTVFIILIVLFVIFSLASPSFFQLNNLMNLLVQSTILGIVGFGLAVIMIAGEIDLAFAGVIPFEGAIFATLLTQGYSLWIAALIALGIGLVVSFLISLLVTRLKLVSFVSTIAMMFLLQGIWYAYTGGKNIYLEGYLDRSLVFGATAGIPRVVILFAVIFVILYILTEQTPFGMHLRIVGEDPESARTMGLSPARFKTAGFLIGGVIFAIGAFLSTARMSGALATSGANLLLPVMTAAFVGQTVLGMGRPNIPGVLLAALLLGMINNAFVLLRLPFWSVPIAEGVILIIAISLANINQRDLVQISM
jgi:ribose/xylose/arabinose/galactoside ABC-type transport system permease subunit